MFSKRQNLLKIGFTILLTFFLGLQPLCTAEEPFSVTVMTLNLHNGRDSLGVSNLERFLELVAAKQPDIIALQEVERRYLKNLTATGYQIISGMNANLPLFRFGNVVLTKHKVVYDRHHYLPSQREQRGLNEVAIEINSRYFRVINTHIGLGWTEQQQQLNEIIRISNYLNGPLLIMGDFNLEPTNKLLNNFPFQQIGADFSLPKTFPTHNPRYLIDLIWYSKHWRPVEAEVLDWDGSDHFPVICRLELIEPHYSPLAKVEIPDLTRKRNPFLPDIGATNYRLSLAVISNGVAKEIRGGGLFYHKNVSLGIESENEEPIFSISYDKHFDLRDYASLWGIRGKAQWSFKVSDAPNQEPWLTLEQYYRWNDHWGTKVTLENKEAKPDFAIDQMYLPSEKLRYRLMLDNDHGFATGIAVSPDQRQVFEVQRSRKNGEYYWSLSWGLYGFK